MSLQESNEDIHAIMARQRAARDRLRKLAPQQQRVVNVEAAPIVPIDPLFAYAPIIAAVSEHLNVSREDIISGAPIEFVVQARKLVLALSVRLAMATTADVAEAFAVTPQTVTGAVRVIDPILADLALTRHCPLSQSVKAIVSQLQLETLTAAGRPSVSEIQKCVCREFEIDRDDLLSGRRTRGIVRPRQIAMAIAKSLTLQSLPEIGRRFGGRDHTTVLHAVRKCAPLTREIANEVGSLREPQAWCRLARQKVDEMGESAFA